MSDNGNLCKTCGRQLQSQDIYCANCGKAQTDDPAATKTIVTEEQANAPPCVPLCCICTILWATERNPTNGLSYQPWNLRLQPLYNLSGQVKQPSALDIYLICLMIDPQLRLLVVRWLFWVNLIQKAFVLVRAYSTCNETWNGVILLQQRVLHPPKSINFSSVLYYLWLLVKIDQNIYIPSTAQKNRRSLVNFLCLSCDSSREEMKTH